KKPLKPPTPTTDRDRPVSRRSKPSSRTAFIGEQPNPWELLHPQDAMSRHRTRSMFSHGVDYIIILPSVVGPTDHNLTWPGRSRRVSFLRGGNSRLSTQSLRGHPPDVHHAFNSLRVALV